jgi:hypothetical protein
LEYGAQRTIDRKRIAVYSGSGKLSITCGTSSSSSDNYMVQAFPKDAWGKKFLTVPTSSLVNNFFRICVTNPATPVRVNGTALSTASLINNFYYDLPLTSVPQKIESDVLINSINKYIGSNNDKLYILNLDIDYFFHSNGKIKQKFDDQYISNLIQNNIYNTANTVIEH